MSNSLTVDHLDELHPIDEPIEFVGYDFAMKPGMTRRGFVQLLGAGLLIALVADTADAQTTQPANQPRRGGGRGGQPVSLGARLHLAPDGIVTLLCGKVEGGQGSRAQITQAAIEELGLPQDRLRLVLADTSIVPNDGITAGSRTTSGTLPAVRQACAAARGLLIEFAAKRWDVPKESVRVELGVARRTDDVAASVGYGDLAREPVSAEAFKSIVPRDVAVASVKDWRVLGKSLPRSNARDIVTGAHAYPRDVIRPGMLYGKVLRPPVYRAKLVDADLAAAQKIDGVVAVRDGTFVGVAATNSRTAEGALRTVAESAKWETEPHPSSDRLADHLRETARGGMPANPFARVVADAPLKLKGSFEVPYVQHAPMETRAAVAEWEDGRLTVWTSTQNPFGVRSELAGVFQMADDRVRVIVPDFGGGFGGKHTGEAAVEAARLAKAAGKPVAVRWTRAEEFANAYFRPAALIDAEASLDAAGRLTSWHFVNVNSGNSGLNSPYTIAQNRSEHLAADAPLRHGSYRALAAVANHFARECFMDELADLAKQDPLAFRLTHLEHPRLRAVIEAAADKFGWTIRRGQKRIDGVGIGIACGTEKGSFVANCVEVVVDSVKGTLAVKHVCAAYECGAITSPDNLLAQVQGGLMMGLGPAIREETRFDGGKNLTTSFRDYKAPRFSDLPRFDVHLLDRPDLPSVGAGETPMVALAPAIANALHDATGKRTRRMPIRVG